HPELNPTVTVGNFVKPGFSFADTALTALTGEPADGYLPLDYQPQDNLARIRDALAQNRPVVAVVWAGQNVVSGPSTPRLISWHAYTVLGTDRDPVSGEDMIVLRNPWGHDVEIDHNTGNPVSGEEPWESNDDGITEITLRDFDASMHDYFIGS